MCYKNRALLNRIISSYCYAEKQGGGLYSDGILLGAQISISEAYGVDCPDYRFIEKLLMRHVKKALCPCS